MSDSPLVVLTPPTSIERLPGYLLRLCDCNGYPSPKTFLPDTAQKKVGLLALPVALKPMSQALGLPEQTLRDLSYIPVSAEGISFFGHTIRARRISWLQPRICPQCLADFAVASSLWDLRLLRACPKHGTRLVHQCAECDQPLSWNRPSVDHCKCGAALTKAPSTLADRETIHVARRIAAACGFHEHGQEAGVDLGDIGLDDLLYLVDFLGRRALAAWEGPTDLPPASEEYLDKIVQRGGEILISPFKVVTSLLNSRKIEDSDAKIGKEIERFFFSQEHYSRKNILDIISSIKSSVKSNFETRLSERELSAIGGTRANPGRTFSRNELYSISGLSKHLTELALSKAGIVFVENTRKTISYTKIHPILESREKFSEYCQDFLKDLLSTREVSDRLGLPDQFIVDELVSRGILKSISGGHKPKFSARGIESLTDRLLAICRTNLTPLSGRLSERTAPPEALEHILAGTLPLRELANGVGLARFGIPDREGIVRLLATAEGMMSVAAAGAYLMCSEGSVRALIDRGHLRRHRALCARTYANKTISVDAVPRLNKCLEVSAVQKFGSQYVMSGAICSALYCEHQSVEPLLLKAGVRPADRCPLGDSDILVWSRAEVEAALGMSIPMAKAQLH